MPTMNQTQPRVVFGRRWSSVWMQCTNDARLFMLLPCTRAKHSDVLMYITRNETPQLHGVIHLSLERQCTAIEGDVH